MANEPTSEQAKEARKEVQKEQQDLMEELTEYDYITRFFKNKCFAFADEAEQTSAISSLINCEDKFVEAYMVTVGKVYQESRKRMYRHYRHLDTFYQFLTSEEPLVDPQSHRFSTLLVFICQMHTNMYKLRSDALTLCEAVRQIKTSRTHSSFFPLHKAASFHRVWRHIGEIMYQFATVDQLTQIYPNLEKEFVEIQERERIRTEKIRKYYGQDIDADVERCYEDGSKAQEAAQKMILKGNCFRSLYESSGGEIDLNQNFAGEMKEAISEMLSNWEKGVGQDCMDVRFFCGICALTVYYYHHFSTWADNSIVRKVVNASRKVQYYRILGEEIFIPCEFLRVQISSNNVIEPKTAAWIKKIVDEAETSPKEKVEEMVRETRTYCEYARQWTDEFVEKQKEQMISITKLPQWGRDVADLFLKCIRILDVLTRNLYMIIRSKRDSASFKKFEIDRQCAYAILSAIEVIKRTELFLLANWSTVEEGTYLARATWRKTMARILADARKAYVAAKSKNVTQIEASTKRSFYHIAEAQCLSDMIPSRNVVLGLAFEIGKLETHMPQSMRKLAYEAMANLELLNSPKQLLSKSACTDLLLRHSWLPHLYFESMIFRKPDGASIEAFTAALGGFVEGARETGQSVKLMTKLKETVYQTLIQKLGGLIDMDLRVLANPDLNVGELNFAVKIGDEDVDYINFLANDLRRFQVSTTVVPIKDAIRDWLEDHWYQMGMLVPNSVTTYTKMTELAATKYGLKMIDGDLPRSDTDDTVAIMDLLRNFSKFVTNYSYFSQGYMFVEKTSDSKRLHTIRVSDLRRAVRKHGCGMLPTAVNAAYMLIRHKLQTFLNFLAEDNVRMTVQKYLHELDASKSDTGKKRSHYKVSWAAHVLKSLAKAAHQGTAYAGSVESVGTDGAEMKEDEITYTYFDKFRSVITQIGNAISLVRVLCQAVRENGFSNQEVFPFVKRYMDDLESATRGLILTNRRDRPINVNKVHVVHRLGLVREMFEKVGEHQNFAKMLCIEFKTLLLRSKVPEDKISPIEHFHGVIPALTVSYVNYMMAHENRVRKVFALKNNKDLVVVDDGFAAGIAFLLHVVNGWEDFNKLGWFDTYMTMKQHDLKTQRENRQITQAVSLKIERLQMELKILTHTQILSTVEMTAYVGRAWSMLRFYTDFAFAGVAYLVNSKAHRAMPSLAHVEPIEKLSAAVTRVLGHNPGPFTLQGTNTYLLGTGDRRILIDTGEPDTSEYITALKSVLAATNSRIECIVITHWHGDHVGGIDNITEEILEKKPVPIYKMQRAADEGVERFQYVDDGFRVAVDGASLKFIATPGHTADHFSLWLEEEEAVFSGDCILGEGTTVFEDLHDYMTSLEKIKALRAKRIYPGHGPVIDKVDAKVEEYIEHRMKREREIVAVLRAHEEVTSMEVTNTVYSDSPWAVRLAALNNVKLVLKKLQKDGVVANPYFETFKWIGPKEAANL
ncbi:unnamed protein product [Caenorhabditis sp. 36 PRJEB53466]|nr:unnamed protein product [Caenorhabditis sp. 36 PRJEB53466]